MDLRTIIRYISVVALASPFLLCGPHFEVASHGERGIPQAERIGIQAWVSVYADLDGGICARGGTKAKAWINRAVAFGSSGFDSAGDTPSNADAMDGATFVRN